jgi:hypothetical protein
MPAEWRRPPPRVGAGDARRARVLYDYIRAEALCDGPNFGNELSPSVAAYFSKRVIRAALDEASHGTL